MRATSPLAAHGAAWVWGAYALTFALAAWLFLADLGWRELYSSHEARAAMNALSLLDGHTLPHLLDGTPDTQKPPTYYALVAAVGRWTGVNGWAVRLPSALSAVAIVILLLALGHKLGRPAVGLFAALTLVVTVHFPWLARIGRIDMPLALCVTAASSAFLLALRGERRWLWAAYPACAAGVLLKGPIGLALPGAAVVGMLLADRRWPAAWEFAEWRELLRELAVIPGLAFVAAVSVAFFAWLDAESGGRFVHEFLWLHNVQRGLGGSRLRAHPWWLYGPYLALYLLPVTPVVVWGAFSRARRDPLARAALAWLVGVVVLLSLSRFKRADYLLPAYPAAALFLGCVLERWMLRRPRLVLGGVALTVAASVVGWAVYLNVRLPADAPYRDYRPMAALIAAHGGDAVYFRAEAMALMYRVGRPTRVIIEWDELRRERPALVVVPAALADEVRREFDAEVLGGTQALAGGQHERPLVLLRLARRS